MFWDGSPLFPKFWEMYTVWTFFWGIGPIATFIFNSHFLLETSTFLLLCPIETLDLDNFGKKKKKKKKTTFNLDELEGALPDSRDGVDVADKGDDLEVSWVPRARSALQVYKIFLPEGFWSQKCWNSSHRGIRLPLISCWFYLLMSYLLESSTCKLWI